MADVHRNLTAMQLYEHAIRRGAAELSQGGALAISTGVHTGRSPKDRFVVRDDRSTGVDWNEINQPFDPAAFAALRARVEDHLGPRERFVQELAVCADPAYEYGVRLTTESPTHALFARNLFFSDTRRTADDAPAITILHAPSLRADPGRDGTRSETAIVLDLGGRTVLIAGTAYVGEIKKAVFTLLQFELPNRGVATMHCAANTGASGRVALFFGLSGTGKTTLSTDSTRTLIGDDEHGWSDRGVFNFEAGVYAKVINLSAAAEPEIFAAVHRFGTLLENVVVDPGTRVPCLADASLTENTRAAFPLAFVPNAAADGLGGHPATIVFLTADAFGVLPPVARLTPDQALYHFLSGYSAKLAGTERGVVEPEATFSAGFGVPFLPLPPARYAELLGERIRRHRPSLWLVNTGWQGGGYGTGERIPIATTRAIVRAIVDGVLDDGATERPDPIFGLTTPRGVPEVPPGLLVPRLSWADPDAYDRQARRLAAAFAANFARFAGSTSPAVRQAGPAA